MDNAEIGKQKEYIEKIKQKIEGNQKYFIFTMGCLLNENDSEKLCGMIEEMGFTKTETMIEADLIVFNTCCIRENAEEKLFGKLGEAKKAKERQGSIIAVGGCMMQEDHILQKLKVSYPYIDLIFGTHTLHRFPENLYEVMSSKKNTHDQVKDIMNIEGEIYEGIPVKRGNNKQASVTIMYGCNNFCTYCIVPYVRGRERSRNQKDIIKEITCLAEQGCKEIMLLGQNVNSYKGETEEYKFSNLLRDINQIQAIERIRFISPHPKDFTEDVIEAIADCNKVCKMIHLPLQSGSTKILKKMNRKYTKEQYLMLIQKMKQRIPEVSFSTDIIVGFPGETEEDFADTLDVVNQVKFEQVYMFIYSRRIGTVADQMEDQIEEETKHERFDRLKKLADSQVSDNNKKYIESTQKVFVEGISKTNKNMLTGRTEMNKIVVFPGDEKLIGEMINVKILSEHRWHLKGKIEI